MAWVAAALAGRLWGFAAAAERLPQWDMAKYGASGLRLADAVARGDVVALVAGIHRLDVWPPLFPLLEVPAFLAGGPAWSTPRMLVAALFGLAGLALFWAGWEVARPRGVGAAAVAGAVAAALFVSSPFFQLFGTLVMLEVPGALLLAVAVATYARWLGGGRRADWVAACAAATALFFTKFNYGLLWLVPLLLHEAWRRAGSWAALARRLRARLAAVDPRRPWTVALIVYALLLAGLALSGGFSFELAGQRVALRSLGPPLYLLYLVALARVALSARRRRRLVERVRAMTPEGRIALWTIALPIGLWMLSPHHAKNFVHFVENRSSGLGPLAGLAFYPAAFLERFHAHSGVGLAAAAAALVPLLLLPRLPPARRALGLALLVASAALLLHPYKMPRFLAPAAPLVWLLAAAAAAEAVDQVAARAGRAARLAVPAVAVALVLALALRAGVDVPRLESDFALHSVPAAVEPVVDAVASVVAAAPAGAVLVGSWNFFSPGLVEWDLRRLDPGPGEPRLPLDPGELARDPEAVLARAAGRGLALVVLDLEAGSPALRRDFAAESAPLDPLRAAVTGDPRWRLVAERDFPESGYRLRVYSPRPPAP